MAALAEQLPYQLERVLAALRLERDFILKGWSRPEGQAMVQD